MLTGLLGDIEFEAVPEWIKVLGSLLNARDDPFLTPGVVPAYPTSEESFLFLGKVSPRNGAVHSEFIDSL